MKKIFSFMALIIFTSAILFGCSKNSFSFTNASLSLADGTELAENSHTEITDASLSQIGFTSDEPSVKSGDFSTAEGIGIGSSAKDFVKAYGVEKNFGLLETYIKKSDIETIVNYLSFDGKVPDANGYDDLFLTIGFIDDEKGNWRKLSFTELDAIWECKAGENAYDNEDIVMISAGIDKEGNISELIIDRGNYASFSEYYTAIDETLSK